MKNYIKKYPVLTIIFFVSLVCTGIFYEYYSCAFSVLLLIVLIWKVGKEKKFHFYWNNTSMAVMGLIVFYLVSTLWAVDSGMAFIGVFKFLPVLLFLFILMQEKIVGKITINVLPYIVSVLTILSIIGKLIPVLESKFTVAGRLAGFYQYPNTFALLLLVSELVLLEKNRYKLIDCVTLVMLITGLLLTGSRTVFVLAVIANLLLILTNSNKKIRLIGMSLTGLGVAGIAVYAFLFGGASVIARYMSISLTESTFVGRILYFFDAFPTILKNPFGLGYMGYYYIQQSIQTGLYSVRYIHNDWLQMMLDVGWIPCILFIIAIIKTVWNKGTTLHRKVILIVMFLHSCFDFNLQFISMFWLFILFMDYEAGKENVVRCKKKGIGWCFCVVICFCLYVGTSLTLFQVEKYDLVLKLYPWNTQAATYQLTKIDDINEAAELADEILLRNEFVTLAYTVKARQAYSKGDFANVIAYKNELLDRAPFQYEEYEEYCYMLINGISLYTKSGDTYSAEVCKKELIKVSQRLEQAEKRISKLGKMIKDQPITELPVNIQNYIGSIKN